MNETRKEIRKQKLFSQKCDFTKNRWFVFYGDEDGEKYNRGFETEIEARLFTWEVAVNGGTIYDIYYE